MESVQTDPPVQSWANRHSDYLWLAPGVKLSRIKEPARHVIAYEKTPTEPGGLMNILFADGHVEFVPIDQAQELIARSKQATKPKVDGAP